nr:phospholipase-like protein [Tanacetum cinerariifolium]
MGCKLFKFSKLSGFGPTMRRSSSMQSGTVVVKLCLAAVVRRCCCDGCLEPVVLVTCCQVECLDGEMEIVPLSYHLGHDMEIKFGREEFCLVTGLRFRVDYSDGYIKEGHIPFRRHVFDSAKDGKPIRGSLFDTVGN